MSEIQKKSLFFFLFPNASILSNKSVKSLLSGQIADQVRNDENEQMGGYNAELFRMPVSSM
ncbi:MAG: hypothetical protein ILA07_05785 [Prevotella sp.]|nr:hypothetical protein [Prevotella sp.]